MPNSSSPRRWILLLLRALVVALVAAGVSRTFSTAWNRLDEYTWQLSPIWLIGAGVFYLLGLGPMAWFWNHLLSAFDQNVPWRKTVRAYYFGHLGKYVPGKALVLVIRVMALQPEVRSNWLAFASTLLETLMMMAVGGMLAIAIAVARLPLGAGRMALAAGTAALILIPTLPPCARRMGRFIRTRFVPQRALSSNHDIHYDPQKVVAQITWGLWFRGALAALVCWTLLGLSLWATLRAIRVDSLNPPEHLPVLVGVVSLAVVAGFVSMLPGGVIVRDALVMELLAPSCGEANALVAAVLLRVVWLVSELAICAILYGAALRARRA